MMDRLFKPVDNSPIVLFRAIFGLLIMLESWGAILTGWVRANFITPDYTFPFISFSFLEPLPGEGMIYYYIIMGSFGGMVMLGFRYRLAMIGYALMWSAVYLMQKTSYNNHYYLLMLLCWLMCFIPADRAFSLDAKRRPEWRSDYCPQWCIWIFAVHITIVYCYAAIAKMYPDWIEGIPVSIFFSSKTNYFLIGPLLEKEWFINAVAWGGIFFDLLIAPALWWSKTRKWAFYISIGFHLFNSAVFQVGIFPYLGISFALFFFRPEEIRRLFFRKRPVIDAPKVQFPVRKWLMYGFAVYFVVQILLPLRHWRYDGDVFWTEEGHRLSWRMMLRAKQGSVVFRIRTDSAEWIVKPTKYVTRKQASKIATKPDMCWQFVQILKQDLEAKGITDAEIYAQGVARVNKRPSGPLFDPTVNLAQVDWEPFRHASWVLPQPSLPPPLDGAQLIPPEN